MNYLVSRLFKPGYIDIESILELWQQLDQETNRIKDFERANSSIWKIWQTSEIFSTGDQSRIYSVNGHWQPLTTAVKVSPCYLRTKQVDYRTVFTLIATEREALGSVQSLIENIYQPVETESLEKFFDRNEDILVQSASIYEDKSDLEIISNLSWSQPITLGEVLEEWPSSTLLSILAIVNIPISTIKVSMLYASKKACQIRFTMETENTPDMNEETSLINGLFMLAEKVFNGNSLTSS